MKAQTIYSRKAKGLDLGVWWLMIVMIILSLGLFSFFIFNEKKCKPFTVRISPQSDSNYTGQMLYFDISGSEKSSTVSWDFGDSSEIQVGTGITHQFTKPGNYYVKASAGCDEIRMITILKDTNAMSGEGNILAPSIADAGKKVDFVCLRYAKKYIWRVMNHAEITPTQSGVSGENAAFLFPKGGIYTVQVMLEHEQGIFYTKEIIIAGKEAPKVTTPTGPTDIKRLIPEADKKKQPEEVIPEPEVTTTSIIPITNGNFKDKLNYLISDDYPDLDYFDKYLHNKSATKVNYNGRNMTFKDLYQSIKGKHNFMTIDNVDFRKDGDRIIMIIVQSH